jgi:uncharacterized Zn finger protein
MSERDKLIRAAERFLELVPVQTRERGRFYHATGHVVSFASVIPDQTYSAVVRGGQDYAVTLKYSDQNWTSDCSCPMHYDCKHTVAAILELQGLWAKESAAALTVAPAANNKPAKKKSARSPRPLVPQPPTSPLYERLVAQLGRPLDYVETSFVRKVQNLYTNINFRQLTEGDLNQLFPQHFALAEEAQGRLRVLALSGRGIASPEGFPARLHDGYRGFHPD